MSEPVIDPQIKTMSFVLKSIFHTCTFFGVAPWSILRKMPPIAPPQLLNGIQTVDITIPHAQKSVYESIGVPLADVKVRLYHPAEVMEGERGGEPKKLPILIYFHGGGFVLGSSQQKPLDDFIRKILADVPMIAVSVDYRLAPEFKLPAAMDDALASVLWAHSAAHPVFQQHGADPSKIVLMGESSGGQLVACMTQYLAKHHPEVKVAHQILVYPSMQLPESQTTPSRIKFADGYIAFQAASNAYRKASYPGNEEFENSYLMQPLTGTNLGELPPGQVIVGECDMFLDESRMYQEALKAAGVDISFRSYPNSVHGFLGIQTLPESQKAYADFIQVLKEKL